MATRRVEAARSSTSVPVLHSSRRAVHVAAGVGNTTEPLSKRAEANAQPARTSATPAADSPIRQRQPSGPRMRQSGAGRRPRVRPAELLPPVRRAERPAERRPLTGRAERWAGDGEGAGSELVVPAGTAVEGAATPPPQSTGLSGPAVAPACAPTVIPKPPQPGGPR